MTGLEWNEEYIGSRMYQGESEAGTYKRKYINELKLCTKNKNNNVADEFLEKRISD